VIAARLVGDPQAVEFIDISIEGKAMGHPLEGRRREPRLETCGMVRARCIDPLLRVRALRNVSTGGFSIQTDGELPVGLEKGFELEAITGLVVRVRAVVMHCRRAAGGGSYISGWRLLADARTEKAMQALVDVLTAMLQFEE
jgi:hypothetical protein